MGKSNDDWPALVIEAGLSESMARLRADASWWIGNSNGAVRIVILIKISRRQRTITIVKCVPEQSPVTSTRSNQSGAPQMRPREVSMIEINQSVAPSRITGAPLILEFAEVIGRPPALPTEVDIQFSDVELDEWAKYIWRD